MALADRQITVTERIGRIDSLLRELDDADRAWLDKHLNTTDERGRHIYPADQIAAVLADEGYQVSASLIRTWRRENAR
jgi:hypothetical protein